MKKILLLTIIYLSFHSSYGQQKELSDEQRKAKIVFYKKEVNNFFDSMEKFAQKCYDIKFKESLHATKKLIDSCYQAENKLLNHYYANQGVSGYGQSSMFQYEYWRRVYD